MMKSKKLPAKAAAMTLALCLAAVSLVVPSSRSLAQYNDAKYDTYKNMGVDDNTGHARYIVPNLYRQDASYTNVKTFPLVVSGGVEYFPLDIFALYSYLEVVYGKLSYGFYINNTKNSHYVAFDLNTGTTTTYDGEYLDIEAKLFYRTYYVPAKVVCETLGMTFETYDDPAGGIRAARLSDAKAKYTLPELVTLYSPVKKEPEKEEPVLPDPDDVPPEQPDVTEPDTEPDKPPVVNPEPEPEPDPYESVAERRIYLTFEDCPNANTEPILDVLREYGAKAVFFLEKDKILAYPDVVRRMLTDGHAVGLYVSPQASAADVLTNEEIGGLLAQTGEALRLVTKSQTRFVRMAPGFSEGLSQNGFAAFAKEHGYVLYDWSVEAQDASGRAAYAFEALRDAIVGPYPGRAGTVYVRLGSYAATPGVVSRLLAFCGDYPRFSVTATDEFCEPPTFVKG